MSFYARIANKDNSFTHTMMQQTLPGKLNEIFEYNERRVSKMFPEDAIHDKIGDDGQLRAAIAENHSTNTDFTDKLTGFYAKENAGKARRFATTEMRALRVPPSYSDAKMIDQSRE